MTKREEEVHQKHWINHGTAIRGLDRRVMPQMGLPVEADWNLTIIKECYLH
jgi:hypothetical protein